MNEQPAKLTPTGQRSTWPSSSLSLVIIGVGIAIGIAAWQPGIMTMERRGRCALRGYGNPKAPVPASMCQNPKPDVPA